ncbi:MAG: hypothetical protein QNL91_12370 [Candidatus Krumholzibacteria bacterium]|nr:hypothetical protein [Candidatus Krumholzibacteria bacterium]
MRKIVHLTTDHNIARAVTWPRLLIFLIALSLAGCGQQDKSDSAAGAGGADKTGQDCQITMNIAPWTAFADMTNRMAAGQEVPRAELEAYCELPAVTAWRQSQAPNVPRVVNMVNWIEGAWWDELGKTGKRKLNSNRVALGREYRYSQANGAEIDAMLAELATEARLCEIRNLADRWLSPGKVPTPLVLNFLPAMAEVRIFENEFIIDTGVLRAGGVDQTVQQIVTLLYRNLEAVPGDSPIEVDGEQAVAECLRVMMNEGVAGWIEQTTAIHFDRNHPSLYKVQIIPEDFFRKAQETAGNFERILPSLLADPAVMSAQGLSFARTLTGNNAFSQTGIAMATVITARLGEERLLAVRHSVPAFFAAYQEAALLNNNPAPEPGTAGIELYESVPALSAAVYEPLLELLKRQFPVS